MHLWEGETSKLITPWYPINNNLGGLNHISKIYGGGGGSGGVWGGGGKGGGHGPWFLFQLCLCENDVLCNFITRK